MPVHVSIHDVSPASAAAVESAIDLCREAGAYPALLVVPNFHGRAPLLEDSAFCGHLRSLQSRGHEIYLHGFFHRSRARYEPGGRVGRLSWMFAQRVVSGGEAEMIDLTREEGLKRLDDGERVLREAGLRIDGFVAPAWSAPAWLMPMLAQRGYRFTEDHLRVYDPVASRTRASVVLNWASRSPARLLSSVAWCRLAKHARAFVPARIAIHPGDLGMIALRREITRTLEWARGDFVPRGADLLA